MNLREKLLKNYENELLIITQMADEGVTTVASAVWDFTLAPGERPAGFIPIEKAVAEIENRIEQLADPACSKETVERLNY
jgi:hypothetical protein